MTVYCDKCDLANGRVVWSRGKYRLPVMIIGEAPGADEDYYRLPFVGDSGKMLENMFISIGYSTQDFYITNICKCRPPGNRKPKLKEMIACYPHLHNQITKLKPKLIITLGNTPLQFLLRDSKLKITTLHGKTIKFRLYTPDTISKSKKSKKQDDREYTLFPLYHPSLLLRNPELKPHSYKWQVHQDLIKLTSIPPFVQQRLNHD